MKKGVRGSRIKEDVCLAIFWDDNEDLESKIDYSEIFGHDYVSQNSCVQTSN